jgi:hypothetical protein
VLLFTLWQLLPVLMPACTDDCNSSPVVVVDDCDRMQCTSDDGIMPLRVRIHHSISAQPLFDNCRSFSSHLLHIRPLVRPDKMPDFLASSLRFTFLRHSVLLI